jgi:hypothetical protein
VFVAAGLRGVLLAQMCAVVVALPRLLCVFSGLRFRPEQAMFGCRELDLRASAAYRKNRRLFYSDTRCLSRALTLYVSWNAFFLCYYSVALLTLLCKIRCSIGCVALLLCSCVAVWTLWLAQFCGVDILCRPL